MSALHVIVLVHGIDGSEADWVQWEACLREDLEAELSQKLQSSYTTLVSTSFTKHCCVHNPHGDIVLWARKLAEEVNSGLSKLVKEGRPRLCRVVLHFVCHSLGGIIARKALPDICEKVLGADAGDGEVGVSYGHFVTLNSPHLGISNWWKSLGGKTPWFKHIQQLTFQDAGSDSPLLEKLSKDEYICCLRRFQSLTAVAASQYDVMVPFCTAAMCTKNPFPSTSFVQRLFQKSSWSVDLVHGFVDPCESAAANDLTGEASVEKSKPRRGQYEADRFQNILEEDCRSAV